MHCIYIGNCYIKSSIYKQRITIIVDPSCTIQTRKIHQKWHRVFLLLSPSLYLLLFRYPSWLVSECLCMLLPEDRTQGTIVEQRGRFKVTKQEVIPKVLRKDGSCTFLKCCLTFLQFVEYNVAEWFLRCHHWEIWRQSLSENPLQELLWMQIVFFRPCSSYWIKMPCRRFYFIFLFVAFSLIIFSW